MYELKVSCCDVLKKDIKQNIKILSKEYKLL